MRGLGPRLFLLSNQLYMTWCFRGSSVISHMAFMAQVIEQDSRFCSKIATVISKIGAWIKGYTEDNKTVQLNMGSHYKSLVFWVRSIAVACCFLYPWCLTKPNHLNYLCSLTLPKRHGCVMTSDSEDLVRAVNPPLWEGFFATCVHVGWNNYWKKYSSSMGQLISHPMRKYFIVNFSCDSRPT